MTNYYTIQQIYESLQKYPFKPSVKIQLTKRAVELCAIASSLFISVETRDIYDKTLTRCRQTNTKRVISYSDFEALLSQLNISINPSQLETLLTEPKIEIKSNKRNKK